jgi:pimeloyl-ACP methyl ester carboxylesterase
LPELSKQSIPDLSLSLPTPNPNYKALSELAAQLKGAVLISHSQSGSFPLEAALVHPAGIRAMVLVEPGVCPATYTDPQITTFATLPILIIFGDYLDTPTGIPNFSWQTSFEGCKAFVARVNTAGGQAQMLHLPDQGIRGNSHMIMQDKNNLQIADMILKWIDEKESKK